ncbi:hypothetical protein BJ170DRAFT_611427 [Xylariales sp. AK1849]|nr:hypothetical protein BJ170DRAFT_611427 [Xylariales sp. AK1849]
MTPPEDGSSNVRGTKRKHPGDEAKLTLFQRLAVARKAAQQSEPSATNAEDHDLGGKHPDSDSESRRDDGYYNTLYATEVDFRVLAEKDKEFSACLTGGRHLDFTDPASVIQLSKTLLKEHFGLQVELPSDRLCPPIPNRHDYILWLKDLLDSTSASYSEAYEPSRKVIGLDVGTGASAIYPLLGCTQRQWTFIATDIDSESLESARNNVRVNDLEARIQIVQRSIEDALIPLDELEISNIDFVMTNPPFYTSESEMLERARQKALPPSSACTGAPNEMICDGGEVGFFQRIFHESLLLKGRVQWYTTMLGKRSSLEVIIKLLHEHGVDNYAVTVFVQGNKTRRWAVGWSFINRRPSNKACRDFEPAAGKKLLPPLTEFTVASKLVRHGGGEHMENIFWTQLEDVTDGLDLVSWNLDEDRLRVVGFADQNVWSRVYQRSKAKQRLPVRASGQGAAAKRLSECALGFSISIKRREDLQDGKDSVVVLVRWLQGTDHSLFESFFGMLRNAFLNVI